MSSVGSKYLDRIESDHLMGTAENAAKEACNKVLTQSSLASNFNLRTRPRWFQLRLAVMHPQSRWSLQTRQARVSQRWMKIAENVHVCMAVEDDSNHVSSRNELNSRFVKRSSRWWCVDTKLFQALAKKRNAVQKYSLKFDEGIKY